MAHGSYHRKISALLTQLADFHDGIGESYTKEQVRKSHAIRRKIVKAAEFSPHDWGDFMHESLGCVVSHESCGVSHLTGSDDDMEVHVCTGSHHIDIAVADPGQGSVRKFLTTISLDPSQAEVLAHMLLTAAKEQRRSSRARDKRRAKKEQDEDAKARRAMSQVTGFN